MARLLSILLLLTVSPAMAASTIADHPSPYIAMHADDPVVWQVWDPALLEQAQEQGRLLFISSGYFACHWCHVMQRESFQNDAIAAQLNRDFISVKIDRELWPELDAYLIDFVERTRGNAGWPLSVFLTPEGHPLVGTTYLPPERFMDFIARLQRRWEGDAEALTVLAGQAAERPQRQSGKPISASELAVALRQQWQQQADLLSGGFGQQSKFPRVPLLHVLMEIAVKGDELDEFLQLTLEQMAQEGLRDHLGGGFFRYTVDPGWQQPHFEKMLIDNAQLAQLYLRAAQRWDSPYFTAVAHETLDFVLQQMSHPRGGYISALSAVDGDGTEGGYYLWSEAQLEQALGDETLVEAKRIWGMDGVAHWEEGFLPITQREEIVSEGRYRALRQRLLQQRDKRVLPRDEKRLAGANGLLLSALSRAAGDAPRYRQAAAVLRDYLHTLWDGERLWRMRDRDGVRVRRAGLDGYVQLALGLLDWAAVSGDDESRVLAVKLLQRGWREYRDVNGWKLSPILPSRKLLADGVAPSAATLLLRVAHRLGADAPVGAEQRGRLLLSADDTVLQRPFDYASYLIPLQHHAAEVTTVAAQ